MNTPEAVLFDFDGVVVDSFKAHQNAWSVAFRKLFNKEICPFPIETHAGKAPIYIAEYYAEYGGDVSRKLELKAEKHKAMLLGEVKPQLLTGVREISAELKKRNIPYGIASNASKHYVKKAVEWLGIDFDICMGYEDYKEPKPSPIAYMTLASELGVNSSLYSKTWVFEDSKTGISAANAAGMHPYGIKGEGSVQDLLDNGANQIFESLLDAHKNLFNLNSGVVPKNL